MVVQGHLVDSLQEQVARNHQFSTSTWFRYGDTCLKHFFDFHRIRRKRTLLKELTTEDGEITGQEDLAHYVCSFYTHLYTSEANAPGTLEAREVCWASTPTRVSNETNTELIKELTLKERGLGCHFGNAKGQSARMRWHPDRILSGIHKRNLSNLVPSILSDAQEWGNIRTDQ